MAERKTGAGSHLSGVLERSQPPRPELPVDLEASTAETGVRGRGVSPAPKVGRAPAARIARRTKGRTVYLSDDLFERILVQAHRKDLTISDYIASLLDRHVPDYRRLGFGSGASAATPEPVETEDAA